MVVEKLQVPSELWQFWLLSGLAKMGKINWNFNILVFKIKVRNLCIDFGFLLHPLAKKDKYHDNIMNTCVFAQ